LVRWRVVLSTIIIPQRESIARGKEEYSQIFSVKEKIDI